MSFSFGFTSSNFSDDDLNEENDIVVNDHSQNITNALDDQRLLDTGVVQPTQINLAAILHSLKDVRLTFEMIATPQQKATLYRRELFDVKHQLMSEDDGDANQDLDLNFLIDGSSDLRNNIYEGGLKSWECSIDLSDLLHTELNSNDIFNNYNSIVELGCGTSLPTELIFGHYLLKNKTNGLQIVMSDYNSLVLRLVSIPNMIIMWAKTSLAPEQLISLQKSDDESIPILDDEILLTTALLDFFFEDMKSRKIEFNIISGSWGRKFSNILKEIIPSSNNCLILTSETIYQPVTLPVIAETLFEAIESTNKSKALIAAKDIYFGVGGSIVEFEKYLNDSISRNERKIAFETFKVNAGLKRSIVSMHRL